MKPLLLLVLGGALSGNCLASVSVDKIKRINCKSKKFARKECSVKGNIKAVLLLEQKSESPCVEGSSFGFNDDQVWVDKGCSAKFEVSYSSDEDSRWWSGWNQQSQVQKRRVSCKSKRFKPNTCRVKGTIQSLKLRRQKSDSPCTLGVSYGYRGESIWVSQGCEANFEVEYKPGSSVTKPAPWGSRDKKRKVSCSSKRNKRQTCRVDGPIDSFQLRKKKSTSPCVEGESYGFTGDRIWVDKGCRAEFEVKYRSY